MKSFLYVAALSAMLALAMAGDDPTESLPGVVDLDSDNFDKHCNGAKACLVEFYAPWCGHCKRMTGDYKKLGEIVSKDASISSRVVIGKVNADDHKELGGRFGVQGFPTIKYFAAGKPTSEPQDYEGGRTTDAFLEFIKKKLAEDRSYGRVDAMDELAAKFVAKGANLKAVIKDAEAAAAKVAEDDKASAELYVKAMKKAADKGMEYFGKESERLLRMLGSGGVSSAKAGELSKKLGVLGAFTEDAAEE